jgi:hypothetical protein
MINRMTFFICLSTFPKSMLRTLVTQSTEQVIN